MGLSSYSMRRDCSKGICMRIMDINYASYRFIHADRQLRSLVAVAEAGAITEAAQRRVPSRP